MSNNGCFEDKGKQSFFENKNESKNNQNVMDELIFMEDKIRNFIIHNIVYINSDELTLYNEILELLATLKINTK